MPRTIRASRPGWGPSRLWSRRPGYVTSSRTLTMRLRVAGASAAKLAALQYAAPTVTMTDTSRTYTSAGLRGDGGSSGRGRHDLGTPTFTYYAGTYTTATGLSGLTALPGTGGRGQLHGPGLIHRQRRLRGAGAIATFTISQKGMTVTTQNAGKIYGESDPSPLDRGPERVLRQRRDHGDVLPGGGGGLGDLRHYDNTGGPQRQTGRLQRNLRRGDFHNQRTATPTVTVTDAGGAYTSQAFTATGAVTHERHDVGTPSCITPTASPGRTQRT